MLAGWQYISVYNITITTRRKVSATLWLISYAINVIVYCPAQRQRSCTMPSGTIALVKHVSTIDLVLENKSVEIHLSSFVHAGRYVIRYYRQGYLRMKQYQGYGVLSPLPHATTHISTLPM